MRQERVRQRELFGKSQEGIPAQLSPEVQPEVKRLLVLWMRAVAKAISEEADDEPDPR